MNEYGVDWDAVIASDDAKTAPLFDLPVATRPVERRTFPMPRDTHDLVAWAQQAGYEASSYREPRRFTGGTPPHRAVLRREGGEVWRCTHTHEDRDGAIVCAHLELRARFLAGDD